MKTLLAATAAALLLALPVACSDNPTEPEKDSYVLQDGVAVVDVSDLIDTRALRWESNGTSFELWIRKGLSDKGDASPFRKGDVLYCVPTPQVPCVLFHKVAGWTTTSREVDYYLVKIEQADLVDVYKEASIHKRIPLEGTPEEYRLPTEHITLLDTGNLTLQADDLPLKFSSCSASNSNEIRITRGLVELRDPVLELDIEIGDSDLREFSAVATTRSLLDCDLDVVLDMTRSCTWSTPICSLKTERVVTVGVVPVWVTLTFVIDVGFEVGGEVKAAVRLENYKADITTRAGLVYRNETGAACNPESDCYETVMTQKINSWKADTDPLMDLDITVSCGAFLRETVGAELYRTVGPQFWAKQYLKASGSIDEKCDLGSGEVYANLIAGNDFGGALSCKFGKKTLWSWEIYDFKPIEKELWGDCIKIF